MHRILTFFSVVNDIGVLILMVSIFTENKDWLVFDTTIAVALYLLFLCFIFKHTFLLLNLLLNQNKTKG